MQLDAGFKIDRFTWDVIDSNAYLVREGNNGLLIDTVDDPELYDLVAALDDLKIILTHSHFDHISGLSKIREFKPDVRVISTLECSRNIGNKHKNMSASGNAFLTFYLKKKNRSAELIDSEVKLRYIKDTECGPAEIVFHDELNFVWEGHQVNLIRFFGHSNDSLIAVIDEKYMFSGDTILGIPTVTRFPGGSTKQFWNEDIPKLQKMVSEIETVFPGHGDPGRLGDFIAVNTKPERISYEP